MSIRNGFLLVLLFYTLCAIGQNGNSIIGLYGECPKRYYACTQLELNSDSTFNYFVFFDVGGGTTHKGTWKVEEDTLLLTTFYQPKVSKGYKIIDSTQAEVKELYCLTRDSFPIIGGRVIINHSDTLALNKDGLAKYKGEITSIQILGWMTQKNEFTVNSTNYSKVLFFVDSFICHFPHYLTNEKLIIDGDEIKMYYHCHHKYAEKGLKKTDGSNKRFK